MKTICNHCNKEKEGVQTGICNHCGKFGKTKNLDFIDCSYFLGQDYPFLTTEMYVECYNGNDGLIEWTDGHRFKLFGIIHSKTDIKRYAIIEKNEIVDIKNLNFIDCSFCFPTDLILSTFLYIECDNGEKGRVECADEKYFKLNGQTYTKKHIKRYAIIECDRNSAMLWWNQLSSSTKTRLCDNYTELLGSIRRYETLTGSEIEKIWKQETQQFTDNNSITHHKENINNVKYKSQVDFEMLINSIPMIEACVDSCQPKWNNKVENLKLFIEMMTKSSTFAHKAHVELKKLNNQ